MCTTKYINIKSNIIIQENPTKCDTKTLMNKHWYSKILKKI